jgi:Cdc6-like AAA superfamily ATPase
MDATLSMLPIHDNIRQKLDYFYRTRTVPHLIFHGSPGTGKRTLVYEFINKIYEHDKSKLKTNVMFVNCAHGKGIKFIRDELKFFAKTNIQGMQGVSFKTIVLFNADSLTIDAQSALRRCIELFSYNTRFFIVVENKEKLLNPILSRFCEIYVPEYMDTEGRVQSLHQYHLLRTYGQCIDKDRYSRFDAFLLDKENTILDHASLVDAVSAAYEDGLSCLDLMKWIEMSDRWTPLQKVQAQMHFHKIREEYRCEKLLMMTCLDPMFFQGFP